MKAVYKTNSTTTVLLCETNLMRSLTARLEDGYYSITVANHKLIIVIKFIAQSCTHLWKKFANKFHLVQHACKILFLARVANKNKQGLGVGIAGFVVYLVSASVPIVFAESLHLFLVNGVSFTIHNQNSITFAGTKFDLAVINHSYALRLKLFTFLPRGMLPIHTHCILNNIKS